MGGVTFRWQASRWGIWGRSLTDRKLSGAQVWLALASALIVLLASGVAISRIGDRDDENDLATTGPVATSPPTGAPSGPAPSESGPGSTAAGEPGSAAVTGPAAEQAAGAPGAPAAATGGVKRSATAGAGDSGASAPSAVPHPDGAAGSESPGSGPSEGSGTPDGSTAPGPGGGGSSGGGQESPPAPSQQPPEQTALITASVSVGEGAEGGVVGVGLDDAAPEVDVTVGTTPLVGDHPPSEGTGVMLGGRFLQPPPTLPVPPG
jgi:hypothetical protein